MKYFLFSYPNCSKCESLKSSLEKTDLQGREFNLVDRESKKKIRDFLGVIKRDDKGAIIIPTLILQHEEEVAAVLNSDQELSEWLRSRD
jgi:arsenate reductase-like glutaredoxin family protein